MHSQPDFLQKVHRKSLFHESIFVPVSINVSEELGLKCRLNANLVGTQSEAAANKFRNDSELREPFWQLIHKRLQIVCG